MLLASWRQCSPFNAQLRNQFFRTQARVLILRDNKALDVNMLKSQLRFTYLDALALFN
jgi:hypothetical protein